MLLVAELLDRFCKFLARLLYTKAQERDA